MRSAFRGRRRPLYTARQRRYSQVRIVHAAHSRLQDEIQRLEVKCLVAQRNSFFAKRCYAAMPGEKSGQAQSHARRAACLASGPSCPSRTSTPKLQYEIAVATLLGVSDKLRSETNPNSVHQSRTLRLVTCLVWWLDRTSRRRYLATTRCMWGFTFRATATVRHPHRPTTARH